MIKTCELDLVEKEYFNDLQRIKDTIKDNQTKTLVVVNSAMIMTYYEIGTIINKRKTWGSKYIQTLSNDLKEYGSSYSKRNLEYMARFANEFTSYEIVHQHGAQIPWRTIILIMQKSKAHEEMLWYINETHKNGWSRSMVMNQFALKSYERSLIEPTTSTLVKSDDLTNELFKDTYVFSFLDRNSIKTEKDLKDQMINNIIKFLSELGRGFSLVGKEYKIITPTNKEFYIDLLMYHTKIHAYVVIEIKLGEFVPSDLGQLIFYVNAINDLEKTELDDATIGLLLCKEADSYVAKTSLKASELTLGISKYKFIEELPDYLNKNLK
jgi:predicted nuclease of restriction endonuclease-like (RecB) superfamily